MISSQPLLPLFEKFIRDSQTGRRLKKDGTRLQQASIDNYTYCFRLLRLFQERKAFELKIFIVKGNNRREYNTVKKYWKNFYKMFTEYLYKEEGCFDNYVGQTIKQIRSLFNWLIHDKGFPCGSFHKNFHIKKEEIPIHPLSLE